MNDIFNFGALKLLEYRPVNIRAPRGAGGEPMGRGVAEAKCRRYALRPGHRLRTAVAPAVITASLLQGRPFGRTDAHPDRQRCRKSRLARSLTCQNPVNRSKRRKQAISALVVRPDRRSMDAGLPNADRSDGTPFPGKNIRCHRTIGAVSRMQCKVCLRPGRRGCLSHNIDTRPAAAPAGPSGRKCLTGPRYRPV